MEIKKIVAERLKQARQRLNLTQEDLAQKIGFQNRQTVGQIENNEREVKAWELAAIAKALHVELDFFFRPDEPKVRPVVLWRERIQEPVGREEALFLQKCEQYAIIEKLNDLPEPRDFPHVPAQKAPEDFTYADAELLADECARRFDLGSQPADSLVSVLENRFRVKIWYMSLTGRGSAASTCGGFGCGILMNCDEAPWRRNFNFAHEVFHLLTWDLFAPESLESSTALKDKVESLANTFAAQLLLPADELRREFRNRVEDNRVTYLALIELARLFGVSTEALLYRLKRLRQLPESSVSQTLADEHFRALDRSTMRAHWGVPPDIPRRFVELAFFAYKQGRLSRGRFAEMLETPVAHLGDKLQEYDLTEEDIYETEIAVAGDEAA